MGSGPRRSNGRLLGRDIPGGWGPSGRGDVLPGGMSLGGGWLGGWWLRHESPWAPTEGTGGKGTRALMGLFRPSASGERAKPTHVKTHRRMHSVMVAVCARHGDCVSAGCWCLTSYLLYSHPCPRRRSETKRVVGRRDAASGSASARKPAALAVEQQQSTAAAALGLLRQDISAALGSRRADN